MSKIGNYFLGIFLHEMDKVQLKNNPFWLPELSLRRYIKRRSDKLIFFQKRKKNLKTKEGSS